jgi:serine/threonine protein phosphatase PrpC
MIRAVAVFSEKGERPAQEDHVVIQEERGIFVIADGFGGPVAGAEASRTACDAVKRFLFREAGDLEATLPFELRSYFSLAGNVLFNSLIHANQKVTALNKGKGVHERGGASVLAGYIDGNLLALANVGCCSAWLFRGGRAVELVMPRTYGRLCDPFSEEVPVGLRVPLISLGTAADLEPEIFEVRIQAGDWILLHTEGMTRELRERVLALQMEGLAPQAACQRAVEIMKEFRFEGNSSVSLAIL